eukprot:EG_transcript_50936
MFHCVQVHPCLQSAPLGDGGVLPGKEKAKKEKSRERDKSSRKEKKRKARSREHPDDEGRASPASMPTQGLAAPRDITHGGRSVGDSGGTTVGPSRWEASGGPANHLNDL